MDEEGIMHHESVRLHAFSFPIYFKHSPPLDLPLSFSP